MWGDIKVFPIDAGVASKLDCSNLCSFWDIKFYWFFQKLSKNFVIFFHEVWSPNMANQIQFLLW